MRCKNGDLVHAVRAVNHPGAFGTQIAQYFGEGFDPARREHTEQMPFHKCGVGERAQHVENGLDAEIGAHRRDMFRA